MVASPAMRWGDKHAIITGASSGIGEALARELAAAGCRLTLVARRRDKLEAVAREAPDRVRVDPRDLAQPDVAATLIAEAREALGPVDVLVNNAGVQRIGDVADDRDGGHLDDVERLMQLNLLTPLRLTREVLPEMVARGSGCIVDVASIAAFAPAPGMAPYAASKAGLAAHSEAMRAELSKSGVHVLTVYPGPVDTPMADVGWRGLEDSPHRKLILEGTPDKLAKLIREAVERKRDRLIYPLPYALTRHLPHLTRVLIDAFHPERK